MPVDYKEFAKKVKQKYPEYANVDDLELAQKMVEKYPEYKSEVTFEPIKKKEPTASPSPSGQEPSSSGTQPKKPQPRSVFLQDAETGEKLEILTGYPGKEGVEYNYVNGQWRKRKAGQNSWFTITNEGSISELNKFFNKQKTEDQIKKQEAAVKKAEAETELSDDELAKILGWDISEVQKAMKSSSDNKSIKQSILNVRPSDTRAASVRPDIPVETPLIDRRVINISRASIDVSEGKAADVNQRAEYYNNIDLQNKIKEAGFDVDVNGDMNTPKNKSALAKYEAFTKKNAEDMDKKNKFLSSVYSIPEAIGGLNEEMLVHMLREKYKGTGFVFEETGLGNYIKISYAPTSQMRSSGTYSNTIEIPLGEENSTALIKSFMENAYMTDTEKKVFAADTADTDSYTMDLVSKMAENPYKYDESLVNEDWAASTLKNRYEYLSGESINLENLYRKYDEAVKDYNENPTQDKKAALSNMLHSIEQRKLDLMKEYEKVEKFRTNLDKVAGIRLAKNEKIGNTIGMLAGSLAQGATSIGKTLTLAAADVLPYALGEDVMNPIERAKLENQGYTESEILDQSAKELKRFIMPRLEEGIQNVASLGTTTREYVQSEDRGDVAKAATFLAESIGTAISGGGNPLLQKLAFASMSYNSMEQQMMTSDFDKVVDPVTGEVIQEGLTEHEKKLVSIPYAFVIGALEKLGWDAMSNKGLLSKVAKNVIRKTMTDLPKDASIAAVKREINKSVGKMVASGAIRIVNGALSEGAVEGVQQLAEIGIKNVANAVTDVDYFKDVPDLTTTDGIIAALDAAKEDAYYGALGGLMFSGIDVSRETASNMFYQPKLDKEFDMFYESIMNDDTRTLMKMKVESDLAASEISKEDAEQKIRSLDENKARLDKIPTDLSSRDKRESFNLLMEREKIEKQIAGKEDNLVAAQKARIAEINNELQTISQNAVKKSTEQQQEGPAESGGVQYQGTQEGQPEVREGERTEGQATQPEADLGNRPVEGRSEAEIEASREAELQTVLSAIKESETTGEVPTVNGQPVNQKTVNDINAKYDAEIAAAAQPTTAEQIAPSLVTLENATEFERKAADIDIAEGSDRATKASRAAKSVLRALPGVKVHLHTDTNSYRDGVARASGIERKQIDVDEDTAMSAGSYINGEIHIDLSNPMANTKTIYHEAFHHAITKIAPKEGQLREMTTGLKKALSGKHNDMVAQIEEFENMYSGDLGYVDADRAEEFLSEMMGFISSDDNIKKLDINTLQKIANVINKIAKKLGFDKKFGRPVLSEAASRQEIVDFMNTLSRGFREGREVDFNSFGLSGNISVNTSTVRKKSIIGDIIRFDVNPNSKVEENVPLSRFNGKRTTTFESDRMTGGYIKDDSGAILFKFLGGVQFPVITGKWWASQNATKASGIAENSNANRDADGYIYGTPMVGSEKQHMSNNDMLLATTELMKLDATSRNTKVTKSDVINLIAKAFKKKGLESKRNIIKDAIKKSNSISDIFNELEYVLFQENDSIISKSGKNILDDNGSKISKLTFEERKSIIETLLGNATVRDVNFPSAGNAYEAAARFAEPITDKAQRIGDIVTVMRTKGTLKYKKTDKSDEFYHKSYPYEIYSENEDGTPAEIEVFILDAAYSMRDVLPELRKSSGETFTWDEYLEKHGPKSEKVAEAQYNRTSKLSYASGEIRKKQLLAPNGRPSNLTEKQWKQVRTPEFKAWFGDWENDPEKASKVVDENGEPKIMYHGTKSIFDEFDIKYGSSNTKAKNGKLGFFFTDSKKVADSFGDNMLEVFLNMRNPIDAGYFTYNIDGDIDKSRTVDGYITQKNAILKTSGKDNWEDVNSEDIDRWREKIQYLGYDGLIMYTQTDSKEIVSTGTRRGYLKPHAMHIAFNPTQIKSATENVGTFSPTERSIKKQISNAAIDKAREKYNLSIERGNSIEQARKSAMADLKKNEWYVNATDTEREDAVRTMRKFFGFKEKKAPSVAKILGKPKPEMIKMSVKALRDEFIKAKSTEARNATMTLKQKQRQLVAMINEMKRGGIVTAQQASVLAKRVVMTNVDNPIMVERMLQYAERLFERADYQEKLQEAKSLQKKIKSKLKSNSLQASVVSIAKDFSKIQPWMLSDIDAYIEQANAVLSAVKPSRQTADITVDLRTAMSFEQVGQYVEDANKEIEEYRKAEILAVNDDLVQAGVISKDMNLKEILEIMNELKDPSSDIDPADKKAAILSYIGSVMDVYRPIVESMINGKDAFTGEDVELTDRQKEVASDMLKIDVTKMDVRDAVRVIEAMDNFITNGIIDGVEAITSTYKGQQNAEQVASKGLKTKSIGAGNISRWWGYNMMSLPVLSDWIFRGTNRAQYVLDKMGVTDFINGVSKATSRWRNYIDEYHNEFNKSKANGKNFMDAENIYERGMYAFLKRTVTGDQAAQDKELKRKIKLIKDSVNVLREEGDAKDAKVADMYEMLIDKLGLNDANLTISDIEARVDKVNMDAVNWWINTWSDNYGQLADVSQSIYNTILDKDMFYTPDKFSSLDPNNSKAVDDLMNKMGGGGFANVLNYEYDKKTGVLMPSSKPVSMEQKRYVNLNFDNNNQRALKAALIDINTAAATKQIKGFFKSRSWNKIVSNKEDRDLFRKRVDEYILRARNKQTGSDDRTIGDVERSLRVWASMGATRALGSVFQPFKQTIPVFVNTLFNTGKHITFAFNRDQHRWIDALEMPISNRGIESIAAFEDADKNIDRSIAAGKLDKALEIAEKVNTKWLKLVLAKPDVFAARSSFIAYYKKALEAKGKSTDIDYSNPADVDQEALNYAQHMVDRQQNASDAMLMGDLFTSGQSLKKILKNTLFPFMSFVINQKSRMTTDFSIWLSKDSSKEDRKAAAWSLAGLSAEMAAFHSLSFAIKYYIVNAIASAIGGEDEPEEEDVKKSLERQLSYTIGTIAKDIFSPVPLFTDTPVIYGADWLMEKIAPSYMEDDAKEALKTENEVRELAGKPILEGNKAQDFIDKYIEERRYKASSYDSQGPGGVYRITLDKGVELYKSMNLAYNGEFETEGFGGKMETKYIDSEGKDKMKEIMPYYMAWATFGIPAEFGSIFRKIENNVKKEHKLTEKQYEALNEVLKETGRQKEGKLEKYLVTKMRATQNESASERVLNELDWIESRGGLKNERQIQKYIEIFEADGSVGIRDMEEIQKLK